MAAQRPRPWGGSLICAESQRFCFVKGIVKGAGGLGQMLETGCRHATSTLQQVLSEPAPFPRGIRVIYKRVARAPSSASPFPRCWQAAQPGLCSGSCTLALNSCCEAVPALLLPQRAFSARLANGWVSPIQSAEQCGDTFRFY